VPQGSSAFNSRVFRVSRASFASLTSSTAHACLTVAARMSRLAKRANLSPGWVHTGLTGANNGGPKPSGAWTPEQTVDYMTDKIFNHGDFYVICPDNETTTVSWVARALRSPLTIANGPSAYHVESGRYHREPASAF